MTINSKISFLVRHPRVTAASSLASLSCLALSLTTLLFTAKASAQTEPSALLEVQSTNKGFLLSRMTKAQRDSIPMPATGLMIFSTTSGSLEINMGTPAAPNWYRFMLAGEVASLNCAGATLSSGITSSTPVSDVTVSVPYSGGNGAAHSGQTATSTLIAGLKATLPAGNFANGAGTLLYEISGTPATSGMANFHLNIGGQSCTLSIFVLPICRAKISSTTFKNFMCHNLGAANTLVDPFEPSWEINGGYWQWGRKGPGPSAWLTSNSTNFAHGPTGPGLSSANAFAITGWSSTGAPDGAWSDNTKTANDPCPTGYRLPTIDQWAAVIANNADIAVGTWTGGIAAYNSGRFYGNSLFLPAAGFRDNLNSPGALSNRNNVGLYWSSSECVGDCSKNLIFNDGNSFAGNVGPRTPGYSLRCIAE